VLVILSHERRRIVHLAMTEHPTAAWTAQPLREAFPLNDGPRYLLHDRDHAFAAWARTATAMDIREVLTAPRSPWQNAYVETLHRIGAPRMSRPRPRVQRERTPPVAARVWRVLRTIAHHLSLHTDTPIPRPIAAPAEGRVVAIPQVGGPHHRYERWAASQRSLTCRLETSPRRCPKRAPCVDL
jgi:hypothetical protein